MSLAAFTWTDRARPIVEVGIGDTRVPVGQATWDHARWDDDAARWSGDDPTWVDVTCEAFEFRCEYGRRRSIDRYVPGVAQVLVDNSTGWADPHASNPPGVLTMRPGRPIRLGVEHAVFGRRWLFRGFVDAMTPTYDPTRTDVVLLDCVDALGEVNRVKLVPIDPPAYAGETVDARIARILDVARWSDVKRDLDPASDTLLASDLGGQVADLLGQAAESNGGSIFGDTAGNVVYRGRDWQMFVPGTPPDGTIGNVDPGVPGYWVPGVPAVPAYLTPPNGYAYTDDPGTLPARFTLTAHVVIPYGLAAGTTYQTIMAQRGTGATEMSFQWIVSSAGSLVFRRSSNGTGIANSTLGPAPAEGTECWLRVDVDQTALTAHGLQSLDGGATWAEVGPAATIVAPLYNSSSRLTVGVRGYSTSPGDIYTGRILFASLTTPTGIMASFDPANAGNPVTSPWYDVTGKAWRVDKPAGITPGVPAVPPVWVPPIPGDVCPVQWDRPFARADMATRVIIGRDPLTAKVVDDDVAQLLYGIEPFERVDLLTASDETLDLLAARILDTRSAESAPRVRAVTLDARTADAALDLMSTVDVYLPSRYRCRLAYNRGLVFDAEHFATGVAHTVTPRMWSLELNLDLAAPYEAGAARWDTNLGWDRALWSALT